MITGKEKLSYNPLYLQVKDVILKRIIDGIYPQGSLIPSESRLAEDFGTSISTIRQALSILVSEQQLEKKQGRGTFVSENKVKITFLTWLAETEKGRQLVEEIIDLFHKEHPSVLVEPIYPIYPKTRDTL
ncbi:MAG: GntR family transcriptional regulator, partial [Spirochaetales bacterium]